MDSAYFNSMCLIINSKSEHELAKSTRSFINIVWEIMNIIKENMPSHIEISFHGPLCKDLGF